MRHGQHDFKHGRCWTEHPVSCDCGASQIELHRKRAMEAAADAGVAPNEQNEQKRP